MALAALVLVALPVMLAGCANSDAPPEAPEPTLIIGTEPAAGCDPNYTGCVPLADYDLDCADIGRSVEVIGGDVHGFDRDGNGYGCESYG